MSTLRDRLLLRELIGALLNEAIGSSFVEAEKRAREKLEQAGAEHEEWEREKAKKDAVEATIARQGGTPNAAKTLRSKLRKEPRFNYNEKVLQKSEKNLLDAIHRAEEELGKYDLDRADVEKLSRPKANLKAAEGVPPPQNKKAYVTPSTLPTMTMMSWNDPRWAKPAARVELGFKKGLSSKAPPGEERLAEIFGAQRQGDKVSFDLVDQEGKRWEVKGLASKGDTIRPGKQGAAAFVKAAKYMVQICVQMQQFANEIKKQGEAAVCTTERQLKAAKIINVIMKAEFKEIVSKELSEERLRKVLMAMRATAFLKLEWEEEIGQKTGGMLLHTAGDVEIKDRRAWIDIMNRIAKQPGGEKALADIAPREKCLFKLQDSKAFADPVRWMDSWENHIDIKRIFAEVDGVIVVLPEGFFIIPPTRFRESLVFKGVSQDVPRYSVRVDQVAPSAAPSAGEKEPEAAIA